MPRAEAERTQIESDIVRTQQEVDRLKQIDQQSKAAKDRDAALQAEARLRSLEQHSQPVPREEVPGPTEGGRAVWSAIQALADNGPTDTPKPEAEKPNTGRKQIKAAAKPVKEATGAKKPPAKPKTDSSNKKAEVIAMLRRAIGATPGIASGTLIPIRGNIYPPH